MGNFRGLVTNFTPGSGKQLEFIVEGIPDGVFVTGASFIVKSRPQDADTSPVVSKTLSATYVGGVGQIVDDGTDGTWRCLVDLSPADTTAIGMNRMSFYLALALDSFPTIYIPFVGWVAANALSVAL